MKAFVSSLLTLAVVALLLQLVFTLQAFNLREPALQKSLFNAKYADYYFDDISYDIIHLAPDNPYVRRINSTYVAIGFTSRMTNMTFQSAFGNYSEKIAAVSGKINANITLNTSLIGGNSITYTFSNGVTYTSDYNNPAKSQLVSSDAVSFKNYSIVFATNLTRNSLNDFNFRHGGGQNKYYVKINFTDATGTFLDEGYLVENPNQQFAVTFGNGGQFNIHINEVDGNPKSMIIEKSNVDFSAFAVEAIMENNGTYPVYIYIPVYLNITGPGYSKDGTPAPLGV